MGRTPDDARRWTRAGTALLAGALAGLAEPDLAAPSRLPGWTRKHLLAHVAANADALGNLVRWAATGEPTPMYASPQQRNADIEAGARRPGAELTAWYDRSAAALESAMDALTDAQWRAEVVTAQGRAVPATEIPWLRAREVMVHAVDLDAGVAFADLPADFLTALVDDIVARRTAQAGAAVPALAVEATDTGGRWTIAGAGEPVTVAGPLAALTSYLSGRGTDATAATGGLTVTGGGAVPDLPPWL